LVLGLRRDRVGLLDHRGRIRGRRRWRLISGRLRESDARGRNPNERQPGLYEPTPVGTLNPHTRSPQRPLRQSLCDCETPAWFSAAEKLGLAINAAIFG